MYKLKGFILSGFGGPTVRPGPFYILSKFRPEPGPASGPPGLCRAPRYRNVTYGHGPLTITMPCYAHGLSRGKNCEDVGCNFINVISCKPAVRSAIPKGRHSEGSAILKAVIHGRCREQFLILPQPDD